MEPVLRGHPAAPQRTNARRKPFLLNHLSTANVARDVDVLRRALGDDKLTFIGHSYGGMIGATYANLFPQKVRAIILDSAPNPEEFLTGNSPADTVTPFSLRVGSHVATSNALRYFFETCRQAGPACAFSAGDPAAEFDRVMRKLREIGPIEIDVPGAPPVISYAFMVDALRGALQFPPIWPEVAANLDFLRTLVDSAPAASRATKAAGYDNGREALHASTPAMARDLTRLLGNARLVSVEGAGHTIEALDSPCVTAVIEQYFLTKALPPAGTVCAQQSVPFGNTAQATAKRAWTDMPVTR